MTSHPIEILAAILATLLQDDTEPQRAVPPSWMTPSPKGRTAIPCSCPCTHKERQPGVKQRRQPQRAVPPTESPEGHPGKCFPWTGSPHAYMNTCMHWLKLTLTPTSIVILNTPTTHYVHPSLQPSTLNPQPSNLTQTCTGHPSMWTPWA